MLRVISQSRMSLPYYPYTHLTIARCLNQESWIMNQGLRSSFCPSIIHDSLFMIPHRTIVRCIQVWAFPFSLAATKGITFVLFSSAYWDVSLQRVCIPSSYETEWCRFTTSGFPIRKSPDHRLLRTYPRHIAATPRPSSLLCVKASTIRP